MQEILDEIIGENKSAAIKIRTTLHTLSTIRDITDMSNTPNEQLATISLDFFSQCGLRFYFLYPSCFWLQKQINPYDSSCLYQ